MLDVKRLKAYLALAGLTTKDLAEKEGWSLPTAYRKVNGHSSWLGHEIVACKELLNLNADEVDQIFFALRVNVSERMLDNVD